MELEIIYLHPENDLKTKDLRSLEWAEEIVNHQEAKTLSLKNFVDWFNASLICGLGYVVLREKESKKIIRY